MADDKRGRDKQARDADRRQREREIRTELERGDEPEPPVEPAELAGLEADLADLSFPATGAEVVAAVGDRELDAAGETHAVADLVPEAEERFDSPAAVRVRVQRPTVGAAMKRVVEASEQLRHERLDGSQRTAYEKTFRALAAVEADDEDEGIRVVADWVVERVREDGELPGSRDVRRRAAEFCRANGYEVSDDDWLGV